MLKVRLTRLEGGAALRTKTIEGECEQLPQVDEQFTMFAPPLEGGSMRAVRTSPVKVIEQKGNVYTIYTESGSKYQIEVQASTLN